MLLVEDDVDTRDVLCRVLEAEGASLECVGSGREALEAIQREGFDVLLSDISMPDMDGYSLVRLVRQLPPERGGHVPAAAISAHASRSSERKSLESGFQVHVSKPVRPDTLVGVILDLAGRAR